MKFWVISFCSLTALFAQAQLRFDRQVPAEIQKQVLSDLQVVDQIQGSRQTPFHTQIFGNVEGKNYTSFFNRHIAKVGMDSCGNPNAVACVKPFSGKKMFLTQNYIKFSHPEIARLMILFHEARHTESDKGNWAHDYCPQPFKDANGNDKKSIWTGALLEGQPACDATAFGSYGSSTILLKNISKFCSNCTSKIKMDADLYATDQLERIVDSSVKNDMINDFNTP